MEMNSNRPGHRGWRFVRRHLFLAISLALSAAAFLVFGGSDYVLYRHGISYDSPLAIDLRDAEILVPVVSFLLAIVAIIEERPFYLGVLALGLSLFVLFGIVVGT